MRIQRGALKRKLDIKANIFNIFLQNVSPGITRGTGKRGLPEGQSATPGGSYCGPTKGNSLIVSVRACRDAAKAFGVFLQPHKGSVIQMIT